MRIQKAIIFFGLVCATIVLSLQSVVDARNLTELAVRARIDQIEIAITNQDVLHLRKMLQEVTIYGFNQISLLSRKTPLISTQPQERSKYCLYTIQFERPLLVGDTAKIFLCVDMRSAFVLPTTKIYFWIFIFLSVALLYLSTYLPLAAFKNETKQILEINENGLAYKKQNYTDNLQLEIFDRLEKEYQNKIKHKISEVEKIHAQKLANMAIGIAHDLRSPLSVVSLVGFKLKNEEFLEEHELLKKTCVRMQEILSDFQKEAKSSIKGSQHRKVDHKEKHGLEKINIRETLEDLIKQKKVEWGSRHSISYKVECDISDRLFVFSRATLERHLSNLINNSVEAMKSGGEVCLSVIEIDSYIQFHVNDSGVGIEESKLQVLGKSLIGLSEKGMGYGFFAFKQFVEASGGSVIVQSKPGKGTKIQFSFPISNS
jgi:signal transduction histidine kinase